ncbi:MAG: hypothetical protein V2I62_07910 [Bacteroidales bacterium]|jgi:hypothetical protein|nr:hypothetical protein [Bacteroidales bacterium]
MENSLLSSSLSASEIAQTGNYKFRPWHIDQYLRKGDVCVISIPVAVDLNWVIIDTGLGFTRPGQILGDMHCSDPIDIILVDGKTKPKELNAQVTALYQESYEAECKIISLPEIQNSQKNQPSIDTYSFDNSVVQNEIMGLFPSEKQDGETGDEPHLKGKYQAIIHNNIATLFHLGINSISDIQEQVLPWINKLHDSEVTQFWIIPEGKSDQIIPPHLVDLRIRLKPMHDCETQTALVQLDSCRYGTSKYTPYYLELITGDDGKSQVRRVIAPNHTLNEAIYFSSQGKTQENIKDILNVSQSTVCRLLRKAKNKGLIVRDYKSSIDNTGLDSKTTQANGNGTGNAGHVYKLTDFGKDVLIKAGYSLLLSR